MPEIGASKIQNDLKVVIIRILVYLLCLFIDFVNLCWQILTEKAVHSFPLKVTPFDTNHQYCLFTFGFGFVIAENLGELNLFSRNVLDLFF